jgi:predicted phosphate transport protein (TIGR00153 family)
MMTLLRKLLTSGEEKLFEKLVSHMELSVNSMYIVTKLMKGGLTLNEVESMVIDVITNEKAGDKITAELINMVSKGAVPLALLGDIEFLIDKIDDILDLIYFVATEYGRAFRAGLHKKRHVSDIYAELLKTSMIALKALESLQEELSVALKDFSKLQRLNDRIDIYEDRVDEQKSRMLDRLYSFGDEIDAITFNHLSEMIRSLDTIVDSCEDASHLIIRIVSSMLY